MSFLPVLSMALVPSTGPTVAPTSADEIPTVVSFYHGSSMLSRVFANVGLLLL